jgi:hypothetical protein
VLKKENFMIIGLIGCQLEIAALSVLFAARYKFRPFAFFDHVRKLGELMFPNVDVNSDAKIPMPDGERSVYELLCNMEHKLRTIQPIVFQQNLWLETPDENILVTDILYPADMQRVKMLGGVIIRLRKFGTHDFCTDLRSDYVVEYKASAWKRCEDIFHQLSQESQRKREDK